MTSWVDSMPWVTQGTTEGARSAGLGLESENGHVRDSFPLSEDECSVADPLMRRARREDWTSGRKGKEGGQKVNLLSMRYDPGVEKT